MLNKFEKYLAGTLLALALFAGPAFSHEAHNKNSRSQANSNTSMPDAAPGVEQTAVQNAMEPERPAALSEFPTLHPLIVHFPIMLLLMAAALQIASLAVFRREMSWLVIILAGFGVFSAWLASNPFHPHTTGLSENAARLLTEHELYADLTFWFGAAGFAAKIVSNFVLNRKWWGEAIVTILLLASAVAVAIAGHHGAELVHKEGVGPRGEYLELHDH